MHHSYFGKRRHIQCAHPIVGVEPGACQFISQSQVERHLPGDAPVILRVEHIVAFTQVPKLQGADLTGARHAQQKVAEARARKPAVEGEQAPGELSADAIGADPSQIHAGLDRVRAPRDRYVVEQLDGSGCLVVRVELEVTKRRVRQGSGQIDAREPFDALRVRDVQSDIFIRIAAAEWLLVGPEAIDAEPYLVDDG